MYIGNQVRITLDNNTHYYVDLVFYNKILRSYVLIDLKMDDMKPKYALGGFSNNIFASTYTYYIPNRDELINEVEKVLNG